MPAESTTRLMLRVRDTMDRHYAEQLDLERLAEVVHLSTSHVVRRFKVTFGETPHQYLYRRRVERAQWLLRTTDRAVTEIAIEVGYDSIGTFTRVFRRLVEETPTQHRARGPVRARASVRRTRVDSASGTERFRRRPRRRCCLTSSIMWLS